MLRDKLDRKFAFESFGARIVLESNSEELLEMAVKRARKALLDHVQIIDNSEESDVDHRFGLDLDQKGTWYLFENGEQTTYSESEFAFFKYLDSMLRLRVAENAIGRVFVHAGVVAWKGRAVMIPATSYKGKTTLVAELIRTGAEYYSDEYAVLDGYGNIHPFPRELTIRGYEDEIPESSIAATQFGGTVGTKPIRVGAVLFVEFREGSQWDPKELTIGQGIMETIPHTIPVHSDTKFSLEVLNKAYEGAIIAKSFRGDAVAVSPDILAFLDKYFN